MVCCIAPTVWAEWSVDWFVFYFPSWALQDSRFDPLHPVCPTARAAEEDGGGARQPLPSALWKKDLTSFARTRGEIDLSSENSAFPYS